MNAVRALPFVLIAALSACGPAMQAPSCVDGEKNGTESDVDCGGLSCGRCLEARSCNSSTDCLAGSCVLGRCVGNAMSTGGGGGATGGGMTGGGTGGGVTGGGTGGGVTGGGTGGGVTGGSGGAMGGGTGGGVTGGGTGGGVTGGGTGGAMGGGGGGVTGGGTGGGATGGGTGGAMGGGTGGAMGGGTGGMGGGTGGGVPGRVVFSQVQTRGDNGGNDEFIELFNQGTAPVLLDSTWTISFRSAVGTCTNTSEGVRFTGSGQIIPARGHLLITNTLSPGFNAGVSADATYTSGLTDSGNLVLRHNTIVEDALCFSFDSPTQVNLMTCSTPYVCEGAPITNPHDNTTATNTDSGLTRPSGLDSDNNLNDFAMVPFTNPRNSSSPSTP